jgi:RNA polymerase sigma-70 factor (ECF subfamily)
MSDFEGLFLEHRDRLFRYLARASGSTDTAQDLTQEVFLRVSRSAVPTADTPRVTAWLFRIARNVVLDHHRRNNRRPAVVAGDADYPNPGGPSQEIGVALAQALARLDETDRDVFLMREMGGLSYDEIAHACDLSPDAVRSRIYRARLQLREDLSAEIALLRTRPIRQPGTPH